MQFREAADLYLASPDFSRLDHRRTQTSYRYWIRRLSEMLDGYEFASSLEGSSAVKNGMPMPVAVAHDASIVYKTLQKVKAESSRAQLRVMFLIVWRWLERNGLTNQGVGDKIPKFKPKERDVRVLQKHKLESVLAKKVPAWAVPYQRMAALCFYSGMRPNEAESLRWEDVKETYIEIRHAKGHKEGEVARLCKITPQIAAVLPPREESGLVFKSLSGKKLNKDMRSRFARRHFGHEFYATRRGTATEMHKSGKYDIKAIADQLGHKSIGTTQLYIKPTMLERAESFGGF